MGAQSNKPRGRGVTNGGTTGTFQPGQNFWEYNPRNIANANRMQVDAANGLYNLPGVGSQNLNQASQYLNKLGSGGSGYFDKAINTAGGGFSTPEGFKNASTLLDQLRGVSQRQVTGENLQNDPAIKAAQDRFRTARLPMLQSMAAQSGLGRSNTVANAASLAQSNELLPLMMEGLAREERGIGREMGALGTGINTLMQQGTSDRSTQLAQRNSQLQALLGAGANESSNLANAAQGLAGIQGQRFGQGLQTATTGFDMGNQFRDITQQKADAGYDEQQRLYSEALNSIYGPLGMLGNLMGGTATSTQSKK